MSLVGRQIGIQMEQWTLPRLLYSIFVKMIPTAGTNSEENVCSCVVEFFSIDSPEDFELFAEVDSVSCFGFC